MTGVCSDQQQHVGVVPLQQCSSIVALPHTLPGLHSPPSCHSRPVVACVALSWHACPARLDKKKFFVVGLGLFSGVTTLLYPLSVIKTRQMAAHRDVAAGLGGTKLVARQIWAQEGVRCGCQCCVVRLGSGGGSIRGTGAECVSPDLACSLAVPGGQLLQPTLRLLCSVSNLALTALVKSTHTRPCAYQPAGAFTAVLAPWCLARSPRAACTFPPSK